MNNDFSFLPPLMPRQTLLYGTDAQGSVTAEAGRQAAMPVYGAWGTARSGEALGRTGFAGEVREPGSDLYPLGSRLYSPRLRRFLSADPLSPFGEGGLNRYAYCGGDPVNRIDPTGNSWLDWLGAALGLVGAVVGTVMTAGVLLPAVAAAGGLMAAMSTASGLVLATTLALDVVSLAAEVGATVALAAGDEKTMGILGWVAFGTGLASAGMSLAPRAAKASTRAGRFVGSWQDRLQHAGGARNLPAAAAEPALLRRMPAPVLEDMPDPVIRSILGYLPGRDMANLAATSSTMSNRVATNIPPLNIRKIFNPDVIKNASYRGPYVTTFGHMSMDYHTLRAQRAALGQTTGVHAGKLQEKLLKEGLTRHHLRVSRYMVSDENRNLIQVVQARFHDEAFDSGRLDFDWMRTNIDFARNMWWFDPDVLP